MSDQRPEPDPNLAASVVIPLQALFPDDKFPLVVVLTADGVLVTEFRDLPVAAYVLGDIARQAEDECKRDPAQLARLDQMRANGPGQSLGDWRRRPDASG